MLKKHVEIIHKKSLKTFVKHVKVKLMNSEQNIPAGNPLKTTPTHFYTNRAKLQKNPSVNADVSVEGCGTVSEKDGKGELGVVTLDEFV